MVTANEEWRSDPVKLLGARNRLARERQELQRAKELLDELHALARPWVDPIDSGWGVWDQIMKGSGYKISWYLDFYRDILLKQDSETAYIGNMAAFGRFDD